jgi:hypothetical protein
MDTLLAWSQGNGSEELLAKLGRMTLYFKAMDECVTAAIEGYVEDQPHLISTLTAELRPRHAANTDAQPPKETIAQLRKEGFKRKQQCLSAMLKQMDSNAISYSELLRLVSEAAAINAARSDFTHGLVRLKKGELVFVNKGQPIRAATIERLNVRMEEWLSSFPGHYLLHCTCLSMDKNLTVIRRERQERDSTPIR